MIDKIKYYLKKYLFNGYVITALILSVVLLFPLPYYVILPGGAKNVENYLHVENGTSSKGQFMLTYVLVPKGSLATFLMTLFESESQIVPEKQEKIGNESDRDKNFRDEMYMTESIDNAYINFLKYINNDFTITERKAYITTYNTDLSESHKKANIKVGDELLSIDGYPISSISDIEKIKEGKKANDLVKLKLRRAGTVFEEYLPLIEENNRLYIGIYCMFDSEIESDVKIDFNNKGLSGPSAGLMMSLEIYDQYLTEDLTHGKKIAGTGTIDEEGNVGPIGGIKLKVLSASKSKAEIFFAPDIKMDNGKSDYDEAMEIKKERNLKIDIVPVKVFDDAVNYLKNLK